MVVTVPQLANNGSVYVVLDRSFNIVDYNVIINNPTIGFKFKLPLVGSNYITTYMWDDTFQLRLVVQTTGDRTAFTDNYAIIEYTKTTD